MSIKQISIFLENKKGRLAEVTQIIANGGIDIKALSLADTSDFGVLRIIVNKPDECMNILKAGNFVAQETDVIAIEIVDSPGGLHNVLSLLEKNGINVEYMYATVEKNAGKAIVIFKVDEMAKTKSILAANGIDSPLLKNIIREL